MNIKNKENREKLLPERSDMLNINETLSECAKRNIPVKRRTLYNWIRDDILPKPVSLGLESLYPKDFILEEIWAIYILKSIFNQKNKDLKMLASNPYMNLKDIVTFLEGYIDNIQNQQRELDLKKRPLLLVLANDKSIKRDAFFFLEEMKKGKKVSPKNAERLLAGTE